MPRVRRQAPISIISVDVPTVLRRHRPVTHETPMTGAQRNAELNAELHRRDPMRILKQQIRLQTIAEVRKRLVDMRVADDDTAFDIYPRVDGMLEQIEDLQPA